MIEIEQTNLLLKVTKEQNDIKIKEFIENIEKSKIVYKTLLEQKNELENKNIILIKENKDIEKYKEELKNVQNEKENANTELLKKLKELKEQKEEIKILNENIRELGNQLATRNQNPITEVSTLDQTLPKLSESTFTSKSRPQQKSRHRTQKQKQPYEDPKDASNNFTEDKSENEKNQNSTDA